MASWAVLVTDRVSYALALAVRRQLRRLATGCGGSRSQDLVNCNSRGGHLAVQANCRLSLCPRQVGVWCLRRVEAELGGAATKRGSGMTSQRADNVV